MPFAADAFEGLYRAHAPAAFRRALRMLGSEADAHEVVHDIFLSLLQRPDQFQGRSTVSTFLYSAVTHACLTRIRNVKTRSRLLAERAAPESNDLDASSDPERSFVLRDALTRMPEPLAQVAVYYYMDELTQDDIARILDCSRRHVGDLLERVARWAERTEVEPCSP